MLDHSQYSDRTLTGRVMPDKAEIRNISHLLLHHRTSLLYPSPPQCADYSWKIVLYFTRIILMIKVVF